MSPQLRAHRVDWKSEAELCEALIDDAREAGWAVYPELYEWDIVLVRNGLQVGVQAKLRPSLHAFAQALPDGQFQMTHTSRRFRREVPGPHLRCVLFGHVTVPGNKDRLMKLSWWTRVVLMAGGRQGWLVGAEPHLIRWSPRVKFPIWHYRWPGKRLWIPPRPSEQPAGVPSPRSTSQWPYAAIMVERFYESQGWISTADVRRIFAEIGLTANAYTMLNRYYSCTRERVPGEARAKKWVARQRAGSATADYPEIAKVMTDGKG